MIKNQNVCVLQRRVGLIRVRIVRHKDRVAACVPENISRRLTADSLVEGVDTVGGERLSWRNRIEFRYSD